MKKSLRFFRKATSTIRKVLHFFRKTTSFMKKSLRFFRKTTSTIRKVLHFFRKTTSTIWKVLHFFRKTTSFMKKSLRILRKTTSGFKTLIHFLKNGQLIYNIGHQMKWPEEYPINEHSSDHNYENFSSIEVNQSPNRQFRLLHLKLQSLLHVQFRAYPKQAQLH